MDSSPLVKAHDHARAASVATRHASSASETVVAISEHTQAAGEFATAARATSSIEALRTLKLLEEHHRRLAEILKLPAAPAADDDDADNDDDEKRAAQHSASEKSQKAAAHKNASGDGSPGARGQKLSPPTQRRYASREMSSSIASNLATARGIRSKYRGQPLAPSVSNDQAPGNVDGLSRPQGPNKAKMQNLIDQQSSGRPTWVPPTASSAAQQARSETGSAQARGGTTGASEAAAAADDGGYTRFYNTFGSLINKISAPLAFAGLPLIQEESTLSETSSESPDASPSKRGSGSGSGSGHLKASPSKLLEPDLSKIYSRATMQALAREGHGSTNDSFYVVPTTGHTMSYANILTYAEKEKRRLGASTHGDAASTAAGEEEDDDDFVDARESPATAAAVAAAAAASAAAPLSPGAKRRIGRARTDKELGNTIEELYTENKSLKDMLDKLTKRLHAFEASAQTSAMALAESYRLMRPGSPSATAAAASSPAAKSEEALRRRNQEVEEQLAATVKHMERLERDNRKMQKTLEKYREKWEVLKAGAKARRGAQGVGESVEDASGSPVP